MWVDTETGVGGYGNRCSDTKTVVWIRNPLPPCAHPFGILAIPGLLLGEWIFVAVVVVAECVVWDCRVVGLVQVIVLEGGCGAAAIEIGRIARLVLCTFQLQLRSKFARSSEQ